MSSIFFKRDLADSYADNYRTTKCTKQFDIVFRAHTRPCWNAVACTAILSGNAEWLRMALNQEHGMDDDYIYQEILCKCFHAHCLSDPRHRAVVCELIHVCSMSSCVRLLANASYMSNNDMFELTCTVRPELIDATIMNQVITMACAHNLPPNSLPEQHGATYCYRCGNRAHPSLNHDGLAKNVIS